MKHLILILTLTLVGLGACKKDKPTAVKTFADYSLGDIVAQQANISAELVTYDHQSLTNFKAGSILFFKTTAGNYGKMEVLSVDANLNLKLNLVVYNSQDGTVLLQKSAITLGIANNVFDLDDPNMPAVITTDADFGWMTVGGYRCIYFVDANGANVMLFKI
jgi:hypothetical protein